MEFSSSRPNGNTTGESLRRGEGPSGLKKQLYNQPISHSGSLIEQIHPPVGPDDSTTDESLRRQEGPSRLGEDTTSSINPTPLKMMKRV